NNVTLESQDGADVEKHAYLTKVASLDETSSSVVPSVVASLPDSGSMSVIDGDLENSVHRSVLEGNVYNQKKSSSPGRGNLYSDV
ncbi:hypothetical protein, partial [Mycobacterium tuberculosis]